MSDPLDIATRHGLPDELRVLARLYPRSDWHGHPNFSDLVAFWLDRHLMFREIITRMQSATQMHMASPQARFGTEIARYTGFFLNQLHEHHGIEDHHYFPHLKTLDFRLVRAFDMLDADHHALDGHIHALAGATNTVLADLRAGKAGETGPLLEAQQEFDRFLDRHLADEEEVIVPVLLKYAPDIG
ncbi:hemerythrin domain-containing protein [Marimonas arenosa]|uniref:Hemerythrin domain-containing protein n=1 Tax=Marimonas arenosa TaxID=1795305 RepID=A0AAE4B4P8_9RHOB|nr:hemerythrin domain-containing protein [Marimonas arenosa]MDQ2088311.1 hemerythrin domain-containing protein [Marimonas arenosa]